MSDDIRYERVPYSGPIWAIGDGEIGPVVGWEFKVGIDDGDIYGGGAPIIASREYVLPAENFALYPTREEAERADDAEKESSP